MSIPQYPYYNYIQGQQYQIDYPSFQNSGNADVIAYVFQNDIVTQCTTTLISTANNDQTYTVTVDSVLPDGGTVMLCFEMPFPPAYPVTQRFSQEALSIAISDVRAKTQMLEQDFITFGLFTERGNTSDRADKLVAFDSNGEFIVLIDDLTLPDLANLVQQVADNTAQIAVNTQDIADNVIDISQNTNDIAQNASDIAAIDVSSKADIQDGRFKNSFGIDHDGTYGEIVLTVGSTGGSMRVRDLNGQDGVLDLNMDDIRLMGHSLVTDVDLDKKVNKLNPEMEYIVTHNGNANTITKYEDYGPIGEVFRIYQGDSTKSELVFAGQSGTDPMFSFSIFADNFKYNGNEVLTSNWFINPRFVNSFGMANTTTEAGLVIEAVDDNVVRIVTADANGNPARLNIEDSTGGQMQRVDIDTERLTQSGDDVALQKAFVTLTQAEYDALTPDPDTYYFIEE